MDGQLFVSDFHEPVFLSTVAAGRMKFRCLWSAFFAASAIFTQLHTSSPVLVTSICQSRREKMVFRCDFPDVLWDASATSKMKACPAMILEALITGLQAGSSLLRLATRCYRRSIGDSACRLLLFVPMPFETFKPGASLSWHA